MAETIVQSIEIKGDASSYNAASDSANKSTKNLGDGIAKLGTQILAAKLGYDAFFGAIKQGLGDALEWERAQIKLTASLSSLGFEVSANVAGLSAMAEALEDTTNISGETIQGLQSLALNMGVMPEQMQATVEAAIRLSNVTGKDLNSSLMTLVKTQDGALKGLAKFIPGLADLTDAQLEAGEGTKLINKALSEQLGILTEGTSGSIMSLGNAWENMTKALGIMVIAEPGITGAIASITGAIKGLTMSLEEGHTLEMLEAWMQDLMGNEQGKATAESLYAHGNRSKAAGSSQLSNLAPSGDVLAPSLAAIPKPKKSGSAFDFAGKTDDMLDREGEAVRAMRDQDAAQDLEEAARMERQEAAQEEIDTARHDRAESWHQRQLAMIDEKFALGAKASKELVDIEIANQEAAAKEIEEVQKAGMRLLQTSAQAFGGFLVDIISNAAGENKKSFDEILKSFLKGLGQQLIGMGIYYGIEGVGRVIESEGVSPSGYALIGLGAAATAAGAAMMAGSTAIKVPDAAGASAGGGSGGAGSSKTSDAEIKAQERHVTINVIGDLSDNDARIIQDGLARSNARGF